MTFFTHAREAFVIGFLKQFHWITFLKQKIDWKKRRKSSIYFGEFCLPENVVHTFIKIVFARSVD